MVHFGEQVSRLGAMVGPTELKLDPRWSLVRFVFLESSFFYFSAKLLNKHQDVAVGKQAYFPELFVLFGVCLARGWKWKCKCIKQRLVRHFLTEYPAELDHLLNRQVNNVKCWNMRQRTLALLMLNLSTRKVSHRFSVKSGHFRRYRGLRSLQCIQGCATKFPRFNFRLRSIFDKRQHCLAL